MDFKPNPDLDDSDIISGIQISFCNFCTNDDDCSERSDHGEEVECNLHDEIMALVEAKTA